MREKVELSGVVLSAQNVGEYDKRLVILTRERGRITAFAHGVRRPKNPLMAAANPFVFAVFSLYEGKDAYSLASASASEYFTELASKMPGVLYGYYFLEIADYFGREGIEAADTVNLIYVALRAILKEQLPLPMIRAVYELRTLVENGLYAPPGDREGLTEAAFSALHYVSSCRITGLYAFRLKEEAASEFETCVQRSFGNAVDKMFKSLAVIAKME